MSKIIQNQFFKFHDNIKLEVEDNKQLIEKRKMLVDEIRDFLKKKSEAENRPLITFTEFNQGSYSMGTGNKPVNDEDDYDIDTGLLFDISKTDYTPLQVKKWVHDALSIKQFRKVEWKKACIRVQYIEEGFPKFHVDFAVYSVSESNDDKKTYLAKGTPTISSDQIKWEESEPKRLKELINSKFSDSEHKSQFIRSIRYYKRWKDNKFLSVNGKPTGISITALALNGFVPCIKKNTFNNQLDVDDHMALIQFTKYILGQFSWTGRIQVKLPIPPYNDLFDRMTDEQCKLFKEKLERLKESLDDAYSETDPQETCKILRKEFGDDFPIPPREETAQGRRKAVVGTSESA